MQSSIRLSLSLSSAVALALANAPVQQAAAQEQGSADDIGVMEINLKDAVKFNWGFQGALQGAGTPNQAGAGAFVPIAIGDNNVFFLDTLFNANFADYPGYTSIINTQVEGVTFSTSSRLGYRWLNDDRSWMFGINAGYDSRPMATGRADTGVTVTDRNTVFFQQVAAGLEAVSDGWNFNAYALIPVGTEEYRINSRYSAAALDTYGLDVGYSITPDFKASVGYYYQQSDLEAADGSGIDGRLAYDISNGLVAGVNVSYDQAFETRVSADLKYRFGADGYGAPSKKKAWSKPTIQGLSETVKQRNIRVHDKSRWTKVVYKKYYCSQPTKNNPRKSTLPAYSLSTLRTKASPGFKYCNRREKLSSFFGRTTKASTLVPSPPYPPAGS